MQPYFVSFTACSGR